MQVVKHTLLKRWAWWIYSRTNILYLVDPLFWIILRGYRFSLLSATISILTLVSLSETRTLFKSILFEALATLKHSFKKTYCHSKSPRKVLVRVSHTLYIAVTSYYFKEYNSVWKWQNIQWEKKNNLTLNLKLSILTEGNFFPH